MAPGTARASGSTTNQFRIAALNSYVNSAELTSATSRVPKCETSLPYTLPTSKRRSPISGAWSACSRTSFTSVAMAQWRGARCSKRCFKRSADSQSRKAGISGESFAKWSASQSRNADWVHYNEHKTRSVLHKNVPIPKKERQSENEKDYRAYHAVSAHAGC